MPDSLFDDLSPVLALPLLQPAQAQKHITHNEALRLLDILVQPVVASRSATTPPEDPAPGTRHIVAAAATGLWAGHEDAIACAEGEGWLFIPPQPGWRAHILDENAEALFDGSAWVTADAMTARFARLGVGTAPDSLNRLAVASGATLLTHAGAGHQLVMNKAGSPQTASLLFQTAWSGRAEMGTTGSDDFAIKVSADGSAWATALTVARANGQVSLPVGLTLGGALTGAGVISGGADTAAGRVLVTGAGGVLGAAPVAPANINTANALAPGCWYRITDTGTTTGLPDALAGGIGPSGGHLLHQRRADGSEFQLLAMDHAALTRDSGLWIRWRNGTAWSGADWRRVIDTGNLVGPVLTTAGLPAGGVLEEGSGANGHWLRLASGLQICRHVLSSGTGGGVSWSFPKTFAAAPQLTLTVEATSPRIATVSGVSSSAALMHVFDTAGTRQAHTVHLTASGRWL